MVSVEEWKKLGYTDEQCQDLERLSEIDDGNLDNVDVHNASQTLSEAMKKYQLDKNEVERIIDKLIQIPN